MPNYMAVYTGVAGQDPAPMSKDQMEKGMAAWGKWGEEHKDAIVAPGGPLGKTKMASKDGISDTRNALAAYVIVRAPDHNAAVKMFENHPHFTIFPGKAVEVMEILPMPGG